jgi:hypothetical protein
VTTRRRDLHGRMDRLEGHMPDDIAAEEERERKEWVSAYLDELARRRLQKRSEPFPKGSKPGSPPSEETIADLKERAATLSREGAEEEAERAWKVVEWLEDIRQHRLRRRAEHRGEGGTYGPM